jgi:hypothetical protein
MKPILGLNAKLKFSYADGSGRLLVKRFADFTRKLNISFDPYIIESDAVH